MGVVRSRPTAGQASVEYVAALALVAAALVFASPAVGAPDVAGIVAHKLRLGICLVADDVCSDDAARAAGLGPCPLRSDITGGEASLTAFSIEIGGRTTLTVTPQSDGSVDVVRNAGVSGGASAGVGPQWSAGPIAFDVGVSGSIRQRVQAARGWHFPDHATAERFLEHSVRNSVDGGRWPPTWRSAEDAHELSGMAGVATGGKDFDDRGDILGAGVAGQWGVGYRRTREGLSTVYGRLALDGPELSLPLLPSVGRGRNEWLVEYTYGPDGPRELAFRTATPGKLGNRVTEVVGRLDLRDGANRAVAGALIELRAPWPRDVAARVRAVADRIVTHGIVERTVFDVDDNSSGVSGSIRAPIKFGGGGRRIEIHKRLVDAGARTGGPRERERFDCLDQR